MFSVIRRARNLHACMDRWGNLVEEGCLKFPKFLTLFIFEECSTSISITNVLTANLGYLAFSFTYRKFYLYITSSKYKLIQVDQL